MVQAFINSWRALSYRCKKSISQRSAVDMCKANLKPETKKIVIGVKTKSLSKLMELVNDAEECQKESELKNRTKKVQTSTSDASKGKKKE